MRARDLTPWLVGAIVVQRLLELRLARHNERLARSRGATEHGREHYPLFFLLHGGWLAALWIEGRRAGKPVSWPWLLLWLAAQAARVWVIRSLGPYWNTRILIMPGGERVRRGPFRWIRHPNYLVVALELLSGALAVRSPRTAGVFSVLNAALLLGLRIPAEERALRAYQERQDEKASRSSSG